MHLTRLQLTGFKTFADKTEITFSPGVTAIVGPNGSGKSNIADAVLWVLGEQKASALRGVKTQDVIFSGSANRKPLGFAEVSLTVDNSDRILPVGFDEVTISRRAYRSGEAEYFLNKTPCRLRDLYELFLDTGVGREAYAIVNQSEIDAVLSADPEKRRGLFEEAAGIKKYRVKKREAIRKLDVAAANLTRVRDIMSEIEAQLEPLASQADLARRYRGLKERLSQIERDHLIAELRLADYELSAAAEARQEEEAALAGHCARLLAAEERGTDLSAAASDAEVNLEACRRRHQEALTTLTQARSAGQLARERREGLAAQIAHLGQELQDLDEREEEAKAQAAGLAVEAEAVAAEEGALSPVLGAYSEQLSGVNAQIEALKAKDEKRRAAAAQRAREQSLGEVQIARAEARMAEAQTALSSLAEEIGRLAAQREELALAEQTAHVKKQAAIGEEQAAQAALQSAAQECERAQAALSAAQKAHETQRAQTWSLSSRLRSLQELEDAQEGYFAGVRAVLAASREHELAGEFTVVADSFSAPPGYELALEVALASSLQDIITPTERAAKDAIEFLKRTRAGRATFLPIDRMQPSRAALRLGPAENLPGLLGPAVALLDFEERYRPALEAVLGRVLVCKALDDALQVSRHAQGWSRIVTLTGELLLPSGAITGGAQPKKGAPILERKAEIAAITARLPACELQEREKEESLEEAQRSRQKTTAAEAQAQQAVLSAGVVVSLAGQEAERLERSTREVAERLAMQEQRRLELQVAMEGMRQALAAQAAALAEHQQAWDVEAGAGAEETEALARLISERDELTSEATRLRIAIAGLSERSTGLARAVGGAGALVAQLAADRARRQLRQKEAEVQLAAVMDTAFKSDEREGHAQKLSVSAQVDLDKAQEAYRQLRERREEAERSVRLIGDARAQALQDIRKSELTEARAQMQRSQLAARLLEEYDITAQYALELPSDPEVSADTPREVARLRRELRGLGDVNVGAAEQYEELAKRGEFLLSQKADMEEARDKILAAIRQIDEETRGVFLETFSAVGEAFNSLFVRLFGGGSTELSLTDPDDLLETGVEIVAQPPGKKKQNLALLSGGERALTAAALLFAFLKVHPAPFCVLDEVDAPLDGANVERFADLLRDFGRETQFLVITHNPSTMEAAPIWYGVTMQEPGTSRVLSLQVPTPAPSAMVGAGNVRAERR